jgi:hypothetical protein
MNQELINDFIIDVLLINPVKDIVDKLQKSEFRDLDIKWLDAKLEHFTVLAAKSLFIEIPETRLHHEHLTMMNGYTTTKYFNYFNTLLSYFYTYKNNHPVS